MNDVHTLLEETRWTYARKDHHFSFKFTVSFCVPFYQIWNTALNEKETLVEQRIQKAMPKKKYISSNASDEKNIRPKLEVGLGKTEMNGFESKFVIFFYKDITLSRN